MTYKVVIAGYSQMFAAMIQGVVAAECEIVGVLRHERVSLSPIKLFVKDFFNPSIDYSYIKQLKLNDIKAKSINSKKFRNELMRLQADILIIASWGERLKKETFILPKVACINVHPSLLPKYRGPNPYLQVIKNREEKTGVTFHLIDENYDTGAILAQYEIPVLPNDTGKVLRSRVSSVAKTGICEVLKEIENNQIKPIPQDEKFASYQPQIKLNDLLIDFNKSAEEIEAQIRAVCDWNKCYFLHKNFYFEVTKCKIKTGTNDQFVPGDIIKKGRKSICVQCSNGTCIELCDVRLYDVFFKPYTSLYINCFMKVGDNLLQ